MLIFKEAESLTTYLKKQSEQGKKIGFVPTMGALHEGHLSLARKCKIENDLAVCSIFINPLQFNNAQDFEKYPVTIEQDIRLLEALSLDILFLPDKSQIYPESFEKITYPLGHLDEIWEGQHRPGHFQGVCNVVRQLLLFVPCNNLYLGKKDYQQCMVISKLVDFAKLNLKISIGETVREKSGLAMSSRNLRLSASGLEKASLIFRCMCEIQEKIKPGALGELIQEATSQLMNEGFEVEYLSIVNTQLLPVKDWDGKEKMVCIVAASIEGIRLIDNMSLN